MTPFPAFEATAPVLILAPHLVYPTRNGSDISLDRIGAGLSAHVPYVTLVAERAVVRFEQGREVQRRPYSNHMRSKYHAALRTILRRSHFFAEKFNTPAFSARAHRELGNPAYKTVLFSYISTTRLVRIPTRPGDRLYLVWTHNDEFRWFEDLYQTSRNPFARCSAKVSYQWLHHFFRQHRHAFLFLHVTGGDREGFGRYFPDHPSRIVPIGVDIPSRAPSPLAAPVDPVRLLFIGSLGVRMNLDALRYFSERYVPHLKREYGKALEVMVAGSRPSPAVVALCREQGWSLYQDVSEEELHRLYARATFSLLPFGYATGAKLKLLDSLAHGVPFLATENVSAQATACVYPSLIDDDPQAWVTRIEAVRTHGLTRADRDALTAVAQQHSWAASAAHLYTELRTLTDTNRP